MHDDRSRSALGTKVLVLLAGASVLGAGLLFATSASAAPRLAFSKDGDIYSIAPDGSGLRRLTSGKRIDGGPAWSHGRGQIAFMRQLKNDTRLWLMRSDGTNERRVAYTGPSLTTGTGVLDYSTNGRLLAGGCKLAGQNRWAVTVLNLKTKKSRIVARYTSASSIQSLTWSPDSTRLIAVIDLGGAGAVLRIDVPHNRRLKTSGFRLVDSASWRPDGNYILCTQWVPSAPGSPFRTVLFKPDGTRVKKLGDQQRGAVYSPDGSQYAFVEYAGSEAVLKRADADGSNIVTILADKDVGYAAWK